MARVSLFGGAGDFADNEAERKGDDVYGYDGGTDGSPGEDGNDNAQRSTDHGDDRGTDRHAFEAAEKPHCGERREDHQG